MSPLPTENQVIYSTVLLLPSCCFHLNNLVHLQPSPLPVLISSSQGIISLSTSGDLITLKFNNKISVCIFDGVYAVLVRKFGQNAGVFLSHFSLLYRKIFNFNGNALSTLPILQVYPTIITKLLSVARYEDSTLSKTAS